MKEKTSRKASRAAISPALVAEARAGDQAAFTELYEQTSAGLYRTIRSMVRDEDLAWDILQDTYLQAFRSLDSLEANEAFLSWLRRIAVNMTAKKLGQRRPLTFTELAGEEDEGEPEIPDLSVNAQPELALDRKETARLVREILRALPEEQQLIVGMRYYEDMPIREIAETLGVAPGTVKAQLCFGRKKVEAGVRALERQGIKLYGLSPLPFLLALLGRLEPAAREQKKVMNAVLAEAPAAAGTSAVTVTALTAGQVLLKNLGVRLIAVAAAAALIVGGKLGYDALKKGDVFPMGDQRPPAEEAVPSEAGLPTALFAPAEAPDNACGPDLTWRFDPDTGTLSIEGSGRMYDYYYDYTDGHDSDAVRPAPWDPYREDIKLLALSEGLTRIGNWAFYGCVGLTSVTIPQGVTAIGAYALSYCDGLTSVTIPDTVTSIGDDAFGCCGALTSISIPESVSRIGEGAFYSCSALTSAAIPQGVTSIGAYTFCDCAALSSVTLPESVTSIGDWAFYSCAALTAVTIPDAVTSIGGYAFGSCTGLTAVTIPRGVTAIGEDAFSGCTGLIAVTIPEGVTSIGGFAFGRCTGLTSVTIPGSVTAIGKSAFSDCGGLKTVTISPGVASIGDSAFWGCRQLTSVTVPGSVTSIGAGAFHGCAGLTSATISEGVITIGESAFCECTGLPSIIVPGSVSSIGDSALSCCERLTTATIRNGVTSIGAHAFSDCPALRSVTIPESVRSIGTHAFSGCERLDSVSIDPENAYFTVDETGVLYSKDRAVLVAPLWEISGGFTVPDSVISIGVCAFENCAGLTSVTIPAGVTSIGENAFSGCQGLEAFFVDPENADYTADEAGILYTKDRTTLVASPCALQGALVLPGSVISIGNRAFCGCAGLTAVTIPEGAVSIGENAFAACSGLRSITIPDTVISIGEAAFSGCTELTSVTIPESVTVIGEALFAFCDHPKIRGVPGSEAERYADENSIPFEAMP